MPVSIGTAAASIGAGIAKTIAAIKDKKQAAQFNAAINLLNQTQRDELNEKLLSANTQTARLQILSSSIVTYSLANQQTKGAKQIMLFTVAGVMIVFLLVVSVAVYKKRKK